jgi:hypothetical protein
MNDIELQLVTHEQKKARSEMTLQTIGDYSAFLAEMQATGENTRYMNRVYGLLADAKPGDRIYIDTVVAPANLRKFIGCVCLYIWDTDRAEFDSEYKTIKKL